MDDMLLENNESRIKFKVKAPANSTLTFFHDKKQLTSSEGANDGISVICNGVPIVYQSSSSIDGFYSLYSAEIKVCVD